MQKSPPVGEIVKYPYDLTLQVLEMPNFRILKGEEEEEELPLFPELLLWNEEEMDDELFGFEI